VHGYRTVLRIAAIVIASEFLETVFLEFAGPIGSGGKLLFDIISFSVFIAPLLYWYVVVPERRERAEKETLAREALERELALKTAAEHRRPPAASSPS